MIDSGYSDRLRQAREKAGYATPADAARAMDIPLSTYYGHENGSRGGKNMSNARRYAKFFRTDLNWLLTGEGTVDRKYNGDVREPVNADIFDSPAQLPVVRMPVRGEVRAGAWLEFEDLQDRYGHDPDKFIPVAKKERYRQISQFALRVVGNSMNRLAKDGEYVIVAKWDELGREEPREGEVLVIQRERAMTYEITLKRAKMGPQGWELWPESDDPRHQDPLALVDRKATVQVTILGKVIGYYRDEE